MTFLHKNGAIQKTWYFLRTYILTLKRFDLCLQGAIFIIILLQSNVYLLIRRDHGGGFPPALVEDWVIISAGAAEFIFGVLVAWGGRRFRNYTLSGWLAATAVCGSLVMFFPFESERNAGVELCGGEPIIWSMYSEETFKTVRLVLLAFTIVMCSLTQVSIFSHGLTYLDDHEPHNGPYFYGILICIRLSLGLSGPGWLQPSSLRSDWWHAQLSLCCLTFLFAVFFTLFPIKMKELEDDTVMETKENKDGFLPSLHRVVCNKVIILQTLALAFLTTAVFGFIHYDKAYVQAKFHVEAYRQDPRTSRALSDIFRSLVIIFFVLIFRVRFSDRRADGVKANTAARVGGIVAMFVAIILAIISALNCNLREIQGTGAWYEQPGCSLQCGCDSARYGFSPVCGLTSETTFFSPCHAGCSQYENLHGFLLYENCSCGMQRVVDGACSLFECQFAFNSYQVLYTLFLAVSGAALLMQGMVILRSVRRTEKPVAVGVSLAATGLISYVIGHLFYMLISYLTCLYMDEGRCIFHKETLWIASATSSVLCVCSGIMSLIVSRVSVPHTEL